MSTSPYGALGYGGSPDLPPEPPPGPAENILFLSSKEFDRAVISASTSMPGLPASNLQDMDADKTWRTTGKVDQRLVITLFRAVACNTLGIGGHKFSGSGMSRVIGAATLDGFASPTVDSGWKSVWPTSGKPSDDDWPSWSSLIRWDNDNELPCWQIEFSDTGIDTTYLEMNRIWLDRAFQPEVNVDQGVVIGFDSPDAQVRTAYGKTFTDPRGAPSRRLTLPFSAMNRNDLLQNLYELQRYCGLARDFFCAIDPAATTDFHRFAMQALFASTAQFESQPWFDHSGEVWRTSLTLTEPF